MKYEPKEGPTRSPDAVKLIEALERDKAIAVAMSRGLVGGSWSSWWVGVWADCPWDKDIKRLVCIYRENVPGSDTTSTDYPWPDDASWQDMVTKIKQDFTKVPV